MRIGITAEWNPFHNSHLQMIHKIQKQYPDASLIAAMSGSFVQRGEPAFFNKWIRAAWAVQGGIDVVVELPVYASLQSADIFSELAVLLLSSLKCTHISFGVESAEADELEQAAIWTTQDDYKHILRIYLDKHIPYAEAMTQTLATKFPLLADKIKKPNNLLGFRYACAIKKHHLGLTLLPIPREVNTNCSSTYIRKQLYNKENALAIPDFMKKEINFYMKEGQFTDISRFYDACLLCSRLTSPQQLTKSQLFSEGLEHRWFKMTRTFNYETALQNIKNKRYLYSRLKRIAASLLISQGIVPSPFATPITSAYARLLSMKKSSGFLLRNSNIPIIVSAAQAQKEFPSHLQFWLELENRAEDLFSYCQKNEKYRAANRNYYQSPIIL